MNNKYINYDYENVFVDNLDKLNNQQIQDLLKTGKVKSVYATKTITSGDQVEVEIYPEFSKREQKIYKLPKCKRAQRNLNDKNARKKLQRLLNLNFHDGDYWITLTYSNENLPPSMQDALKNMQNYIRRINYKRTKNKLEKAKYIYVTEYSDERKIRCHHHLVMDAGLPMEIVEETWPKGKRNNIRRISRDKEGLTGMANYLSKDPKGKKRWCASTNLLKPKITKSYSKFRASNVKKMVNDPNVIKTLSEQRYQKMEYLSQEIKFNDVNGRFYVYIRMRIRQ